MFEDLRNISEFILHVIQAVALVFIAFYYGKERILWIHGFALHGCDHIKAGEVERQMHIMRINKTKVRKRKLAVMTAIHRSYYPNDTVAWYPVKWRRCLVAYVGPKEDYNPQDFPEIP